MHVTSVFFLHCYPFVIKQTENYTQFSICRRATKTNIWIFSRRDGSERKKEKCLCGTKQAKNDNKTGSLFKLNIFSSLFTLNYIFSRRDFPQNFFSVSAKSVFFYHLCALEGCSSFVFCSTLTLTLFACRFLLLSLCFLMLNAHTNVFIWCISGCNDRIGVNAVCEFVCFCQISWFKIKNR